MENSDAPTARVPVGALLRGPEDAQRVRIAGRVRTVRRMRRTAFIDVEDWTGVIQVAAPADRGDVVDLAPGLLVEVVGDLGRSHTGQLTILSDERIVPVGAAAGTVTHEMRTGKLTRGGRSVRDLRAEELLVDTALRSRILERSRTVRRLRDFLDADGFLEIDTPVLAADRFAGSAELFTVRSSSLGRDLSLRGSMESHLKQLAVAGLERVFAVGPLFRNESEPLIEFLMVEGVWAFASQAEALALVEALVAGLAEQFAEDVADATARAELMSPWTVVDFDDIVSEHLGSVAHGADSDDLATRGYALLKSKLANTFTTPTFVNHFPAALSPLARGCKRNAAVADRGYLFFRGHRICEIVQEEHDASHQFANFRSQDERRVGPDRASHINRTLVDALSLGCPPMAGFGFHVNRFIAAVTGQARVSDVVPFPLTSSRIAR